MPWLVRQTTCSYRRALDLAAAVDGRITAKSFQTPTRTVRRYVVTWVVAECPWVSATRVQAPAR